MISREYIRAYTCRPIENSIQDCRSRTTINSHHVIILPQFIHHPKEQRKLVNINFRPSTGAHHIQISLDIFFKHSIKIKHNPNHLVIISTGMEAKPITNPVTRREVEFRVDWVRRCLEIKLGVLMRAYQVLQTDLNRKRDFTGNLDRISIAISNGRWNVALITVDWLPSITCRLLFSSSFPSTEFRSVLGFGKVAEAHDKILSCSSGRDFCSCI
ncbi:hypothetical protein RHMOL_Rhmol05G0290600 [Rhododendron molle]|uniref:Uncharacterized protein n=1 Tax=Rhododendron molle TaxID=49168 RepID=A0ACC0NWK1_RHOML|nr:hypothetical protein RHMOL_Rhmol05G0290600 [Rhododendron molle]